MSDPRDYKLDLSSMASPEVGETAEVPQRGPSGGARPFLRVHFACCNVYLRLYRKDTPSPHYAGACPKCAKLVRFTVSPGGSASRDFTVY